MKFNSILAAFSGGLAVLCLAVSVEPLRATQDHQPSEGWEFITKGFGYISSGTPAAQAARERL